MTVRQFVFGYASLVDRLPRRPTREPSPSGYVAELHGHRRVWGVAMDNSRDLPAYKYYVDPSTRERPPVHVTFLDLEADVHSAVNGVVFPVEDLESLDARERNYARREVTDLLLPAPPGRAWAYFGLPEARARYAEAARAGTAVVSRAYLELVHAGFAELGPEELARYTASTTSPAAPVVDLDRIDTAPV